MATRKKQTSEAALRRERIVALTSPMPRTRNGVSLGVGQKAKVSPSFPTANGSGTDTPSSKLSEKTSVNWC